MVIKLSLSVRICRSFSGRVESVGTFESFRSCHNIQNGAAGGGWKARPSLKSVKLAATVKPLASINQYFVVFFLSLVTDH